MTEKGKVSVVVTVYNHEKFIKQCLSSIFKQTYQDIELIIINDGSTDHTEQEIEKMLINAPIQELKYIYQDNKGICYTRNRGLSLASGEYILFVDSDNFLSDSYIESLYKTAEQTNGDIIYGNLKNAETGEYFMKGRPFDLESFLKSNYIDNCSLIRTSVIGEAKYDTYLNRKKLVDYDFMMNLVIIQKAKPVYSSNTFLFYRVLNDSISRKNDHGSEKYYFEVYTYILKKYVEYLPNEVLEALIQNFFTVEDRLVELIEHLQDVTKYIGDLKEELSEANQESLDQKLVFSNRIEEMNQKNLQTKRQLETMISKLESDNRLLVNSRSYRLGNFFIRPVKYAGGLVKHPKRISHEFSRVKSYLARKTKSISSPRKIFLQFYRNIKRSDLSNQPKRALVFVIYEPSKILADFKWYFLEKLVPIAQRTVIVVNGTLRKSDLDRLAKFGEVLCRENEGYDTAAFRFGINYFGANDLAKFDELLLVNDTNIGPFSPLEQVFNRMEKKSVDFWGMTYGEEQADFTSFNRYDYIPKHLQSYFIVVNKSLLNYSGFYKYWENLKDTSSRERAVGCHETVFTKYFEDLGFKHTAVVEEYEDSVIYFHPMTMISKGVPIVKYTALKNYSDEKYYWHGLIRKTEVPELLDYIHNETNYPSRIIDDIMNEIYSADEEKYILIIDGVENAIPQCTRYRVLNKQEQLESLGFKVRVVNNSAFNLLDAEKASQVIIYRCGYSESLQQLIGVCNLTNKSVLYDIDDLVIDTKYTDQLNYTQTINVREKANYDSTVRSYGAMMSLCDGVITSTSNLKKELKNYSNLVLLNRNLANNSLVNISKKYEKNYANLKNEVRIGYFSGSITHNENFEMIQKAIVKILETFSNVTIYITGYLDLPDDLKKYESRFVTHPYVEWQELPELISQVDINIAPLKNTIFNRAKSEIKWIEASLVKVPTIASHIGAFEEMIECGKTGLLANDNEWFEKISQLIEDEDLRRSISEKAYDVVNARCTTQNKVDELTAFLKGME